MGEWWLAKMKLNAGACSMMPIKRIKKDKLHTNTDILVAIKVSQLALFKMKASKRAADR